MILGAIGTGKTSACMYPYVDQLLRWKADDPARKPLAPVDVLLEQGKVVALNFSRRNESRLARVLGVMLKLDFQRAVLQRIPQITADPKRTWRDLLFVCDEYHGFATVGVTDPTGDERTFALSRQARRHRSIRPERVISQIRGAPRRTPNVATEPGSVIRSSPRRRPSSRLCEAADRAACGDAPPANAHRPDFRATRADA